MPDIDDSGPSMTIDGFCLAEAMSKASFFKLRRLGLAPDTYLVPGTRLVRITQVARRAWQKRMAELSKTEAAKRAQQRRTALASAAGKAGYASPLHVQRQRMLRRTASQSERLR
jgi:hypothetical protein